MHEELEQIPDRILGIAKGALAQANHHAVYLNPGMEYWDYISVLNAAHAGELFIKATVAKEHPLLIFKDVFNLHDDSATDLDISSIINKGRTFDFKDLHKLLWVATGQRLSNIESFIKIAKVRNAIQHFCVPENNDLRDISLRFIYQNIDPLIYKNFGLCAIEFVEDDIGYDFLVGSLIYSELLFSVPHDFSIGAIDPEELLVKTSDNYRNRLREKLIECSVLPSVLGL